MTFVLSAALKPFVALLLCVPGALAVRWLKRKLPPGRLRRILLFSWRV